MVDVETISQFDIQIGFSATEELRAPNVIV